MRFDEIVSNKEYRERVIKYFRLPIRLSASLEKFNSDLEFMKKIDKDTYNQIIEFTEHDFNKAIREQGVDEPDFTMEHILEPIIKALEETEEWKAFVDKDYSDVLANFDGVTSTHGFYVKENDGKHFLSIDLKAANWQSLQSIIGFDETYEELIVKHTNNLIPPISKTFRTKITGILGAKNIMHYNQKLLLDNKDAILDVILKQTGIDLRGHKITAFYADEFLVEIDEDMKTKFDSANQAHLEDAIYNNTNIKIHFRPFTFKWLNIDKGCAKISKDGYEILNISKDILLIINKLIHDIKINKIDFEKVNLKNETKKEFIIRLKNVLKEM